MHEWVIILSNQWKITAVDVTWTFLICTIFELANSTRLDLWRTSFNRFKVRIDFVTSADCALLSGERPFWKSPIFIFVLYTIMSVDPYIKVNTLLREQVIELFALLHYNNSFGLDSRIMKFFMHNFMSGWYFPFPNQHKTCTVGIFVHWSMNVCVSERIVKGALRNI